MCSHGADDVATGEGRVLGGEPTFTEELRAALHVEPARVQRRRLACEQGPDARGVEPHACGALSPLGEEVFGGSDLILALAGRHHRELVSVWGLDAQLALECLDLLGAAGELTALRVGDADDGEAALAVDHSGDAELAHQAVAPFRLRNGTGGRGVLVQELAVQLAPAPVGPLHPRRHRDVRVQLRVNRDPAGAWIGDRPRRAMHELGHDQLGAHRFRGPSPRVELTSPACVLLEIVGGCLDSLAVDAQDGCARALVAERIEDAHVLRCGHRDVERDDRLRPPVFTEIFTRAWMCAAEHRREVGVDHLAAQTEGFSAGAVPASRRLTASGVVLDLLVGNRLAQIPHRLLDAGELPDRDHRENPCLHELQRRGETPTERLHFRSSIAAATAGVIVCELGSVMRAREVLRTVVTGWPALEAAMRLWRDE